VLRCYSIEGVTASSLVSIQVRDVNDNPPVFIRHIYNVTWYVGMATDAIAVVKATDEDSGTCGRVLYVIVAGNDQRLFNIDVYSGTHCPEYCNVELLAVSSLKPRPVERHSGARETIIAGALSQPHSV